MTFISRSNINLENAASSLYYASIIGLTPLVDHLINRGADLNAMGGKYGTALQAASHEDHLEICQLLLEQRADVNVTGGEYGTALQAASFRGRLKICQLLLEQGADVNATGGEYGTALQAASYQGRLGVCQLLLEQDADVNAKGGEYGTALNAARAHLPEYWPPKREAAVQAMVKLLKEHGAVETVELTRSDES